MPNTVRQAGTKTAKGYWRVRITITDEYGRKRQKGFEARTLIDAQTKARIYEAKNGRVQSTPLIGTLRELFACVDEAVWKHTGKDHRRSMNLYRAQWEEKLGDLTVDQLDAPTLTRTMQVLCKGKGRSTITKCALSIRQALAYAASDLGWVTSNPADVMRLPKASGATLTYPPMTRAEYERMLSLAEPRLVLLIRLMGECGMRPSEAARVRPEHLVSVHDRWLVTIPKSKTAAGVRSVPVPDDLVRLIEKRAGKEWEGITDPADHLRHWWRERSKTRLYDLRGWCADEWRRRGIPEQLRTFLLGHVDPRFTQSVYESLTEKDTLEMFG